ncbi:Versican core [Paramuricea clavata]|uniref:Versican core n=1 Tax=Paramuricea clavata TaxID=317549 RepID=A0A7D9HG39_PARCT|nr:Versican core [Paramuricea clavata]
MFNSQPQFTIKAVNHKAFDNSCLIDAFNISSGNIAACLEHCLENCRCQSFQICENTKCQLCSSHKKENSSLLHDKDGCIYATYEMRHLTETFQRLDEQCLAGISCPMKYNCCQQSGLCPENKTCKPINSQEQPWKRFTCECPEGYHGNNCDEPITSCGGYLDGPRKSGMHKVMDSEKSVYEVYCHFESDVAWTLVQSYSFANGSYRSKFKQFRKSLAKSHPVSENALTWSGYRLSKRRMESIKNNSTFLQFTCDYEKYRSINKSDYVQIQLRNIKTRSGDENVDVLELNQYTTYVTIGNGRGKIGKYDLSGCRIERLHQQTNFSVPLHVDIYRVRPTCKFYDQSCSSSGLTSQYFGSYSNSDCVKKVHRCVNSQNSTTQLWFGDTKTSRDSVETSEDESHVRTVETSGDESHVHTVN